ncbi:phosphatase PAP2 family protein [Corynebacterium caspium]|uniref:phosphatase PAP2 family protein n=1 Tax=Corynebacterium caspium TaxID=234828 RepID=UPI00037AD7F3|nr:phosphatase PAP2 family protein [Corynebacterium caspium]WKD59992.1 phosphatidylglycerophosphatase B [Corynebacterium caspium DSM 44850]
MDIDVLHWVVEHRESWPPLLTSLLKAFTALSGPSFMAAYAVFWVGVSSVWPRNWQVDRYARWVLPLGIIIANLLSHFLKALIARPRPPEEFRLLTETNFAMPSGHAVGAAALAMGITLLWRRWWACWWWLLALAVGLSRIYISVHWLSDVLVGWALGAVVMLAFWGLWQFGGRVRRPGGVPGEVPRVQPQQSPQ